MTLVAGTPAYLDALFNVARFGASRFGAFSGRAFVSIDGVFLGDARPDAFTPGILHGSMTINDVLDDTPNTLSFSAWNVEPRVGAEVFVTLGSKHNTTRLFAGYVLSTNQVYLATPINRVFHCSCIDYTWRLMQRQAYGNYVNVSASSIVTDLLVRFAPTVTPRFVQRDLPMLGELQITNEDLPAVLKRIASRIGAYFYVDEQSALHFFTTEPKQAPAPVVPTHPSLANVERAVDLSQIVTRALSTGGGGNTRIPLPVGIDSVPVDVASWYRPEGGMVAIGPNRVRYTGLAGLSNLGSIVGPGLAPVVAPTLTVPAGGTLPAGTYGYAYTFRSATGETKPSPTALAIASDGIPTPPIPTLRQEGISGINQNGTRLTGGWLTGDTVEVCYVYAPTNDPLRAQAGLPSPIASVVVEFGGMFTPGGGDPNSYPMGKGIVAVVVPSSDPRVQYIGSYWRVTRVETGVVGPWIYRGGQAPYMLPNTGGPSGFDYNIGAAAIDQRVQNPPTTVARTSQIALSNIARGPSGTVARRLYRTAVNGAQLKFVVGE